MYIMKLFQKMKNEKSVGTRDLPVNQTNEDDVKTVEERWF